MKPLPRRWAPQTSAPTLGALRHAALLAHRRPVPPRGTGGITRPRHTPGQDGQDRPRGPLTRTPTGRGTPTGIQAQPRPTTPLPRPRGRPAATPSPAATTTAVPQHPSPGARPGTTACTKKGRTGTTIHAGPGCPNTKEIPTSCITIMPQRSQPPQANHPTRRTGPHHTITCPTDRPTTTASPCRCSHRCPGTTLSPP